MRHVSLALFAASLIAAVPAHAEDAGDAPTRFAIPVVTYGDEPCPAGDGDEIVVCANRPESDRYRVPKEMREKEDVGGGPSWSAQVAGYEEIARATRPNSCSPVGSFGFSGCAAAALRQWSAERQAAGR